MNLAQAVGMMSYETWLARTGARRPTKPPRRIAAPATADQFEWLFTDWTRALWAIDFFKTRRHDHVMRSFREIGYRAALDGREATLLRAMGIEVVATWSVGSRRPRREAPEPNGRTVTRGRRTTVLARHTGLDRRHSRIVRGPAGRVRLETTASGAVAHLAASLCPRLPRRFADPRFPLVRSHP